MNAHPTRLAPPPLEGKQPSDGPPENGRYLRSDCPPWRRRTRRRAAGAVAATRLKTGPNRDLPFPFTEILLVRGKRCFSGVQTDQLPRKKYSELTQVFFFLSSFSFSPSSLTWKGFPKPTRTLKTQLSPPPKSRRSPSPPPVWVGATEALESREGSGGKRIKREGESKREG